MAALLRQLLEVCFLRRGPQDLPFAPSAMATATTALLAVQVLGTILTDGRPGALLARLGVIVFMLLGVTPQILRWRGLGNRVDQTVLAQAGTSALFSLAMLPAAFALAPYARDPDPPSIVLVPGLFALALFVWKVRVDAAIWRHALDLRAHAALLLAVVLVIVQVLLQSLLSPPLPPIET